MFASSDADLDSGIVVGPQGGCSPVAERVNLPLRVLSFADAVNKNDIGNPVVSFLNPWVSVSLKFPLGGP